MSALLGILAVCGAAQADPGQGFEAISSGFYHSCAVYDGGAWCWGRNDEGQLGNDEGMLGDGDDRRRDVPEAAEGLSNGVAAVHAGGSHSCALDDEGGVLCWGSNAEGQLGIGSPGARRRTPVSVVGLPEAIVELTVGAAHSCALTLSREVWCWGDGEHSKLGAGSSDDSYSPVLIEELPSDLVAISAGIDHTCALTAGGDVWCWGLNSSGQLGDGSELPSLSPVQASGLSGVESISAGGQHTCALTSDAEVWCWGSDYYGQLGNSVDEPGYTYVQNPQYVEAPCVGLYVFRLCSPRVPIPRPEGTERANTPTRADRVPAGVEGIGAGVLHTCAVTSGGGATCWGYPGAHPSNDWDDGRLGDGSLTSGAGVVAVAAGGSHTCAVIGTTGWCWGYNDYGQLGHAGSVESSSDFVAVPDIPSTMTGISANGYHSCATSEDGALWCWGSNGLGQLGDGTTDLHRRPVSVEGLPDAATATGIGSSHSCAVIGDGAVWCWGWNEHGQLGDGTTEGRHTPGGVAGLPSAVAVSASWDHTCALTSQGAVWCWGANDHGKLGDGTTDDRHTPGAVVGLPEAAVSISVWGDSSCAVTVNGSVWCWGRNDDGQLGDGTTEDRPTPVAVAGLPNAAVSVSMGWVHACAILVDGEVWCWGWNYYGRLGNGEEAGYSDPPQGPVRVIQLPESDGLSAGDFQTYAVTTQGELFVWGSNSSTPVPFPDLPGSAWAVAQSSQAHTCILVDAGRVWCKGSNVSGQLGDRWIEKSSAPLQVLLPEPGLLLGLAAGVIAMAGLARLGSSRTLAARLH